MARGDVRIAATLACEECKRRNYQTNKSKRNNPERLQLRKYCKWCKRVTPHRETRPQQRPSGPRPASADTRVSNRADLEPDESVEPIEPIEGDGATPAPVT